MKRKSCIQKWLLPILCILSIFLFPGGAMAVVEAPGSVYVGDYANVLTEQTEQYIIAQNQTLSELTGAQIVVVTVDFLDGMEIEDYAYTIFNAWGIGDAEQNNGLLLLLAIGEENYYAMQGKGLEGVLSSGTLGDYLYMYLEDDFARGDYDTGVYRVFNAFLEWFTVYYDISDSTSTMISTNVTEVKRSDQSNGSLWLIVFIVLLIILLISIHNRRKDQRNKKNGRNNRNGGSGGRRSYDMDDYGRRTISIPRGSMGLPRTLRRYDSNPFGGGVSRGGVGRNTGTFGGSSRKIGGGSRGGFGGGASRGGGAGRR